MQYVKSLWSACANTFKPVLQVGNHRDVAYTQDPASVRGFTVDVACCWHTV